MKPSIANDIQLTPQAKIVLRHLEKHGHISNMEAQVVYAISRLAACIYEIRKAGYDVVSMIKRDETGHKYTNYLLTKGKH